MLGDLANLRRRLRASPLDDATALIEAATLFRSVTTSWSPNRSGTAARSASPSVSRPPAPRRGTPSGCLGLLELDALTTFETAAAAERFAAALERGTGLRPRIDTQLRGIRHQHETHLVQLDEPDRRAALAALAGGWRAAMLSTVSAAGSPPAGRGTAAAVAVWRGLLLSNTPVRNSNGLRLRLRDADLLSLAVRAAAILGVPTRTRINGGLGIVCVDNTDHVHRLLRCIGSLRRTDPPARGPSQLPTPAMRHAAQDSVTPTRTGACTPGTRRTWANHQRTNQPRLAPVPSALGIG